MALSDNFLDAIPLTVICLTVTFDRCFLFCLARIDLIGRLTPVSNARSFSVWVAFKNRLHFVESKILANPPRLSKVSCKVPLINRGTIPVSPFKNFNK